MRGPGCEVRNREHGDREPDDTLRDEKHHAPASARHPLGFGARRGRSSQVTELIDYVERGEREPQDEASLVDQQQITASVRTLEQEHAPLKDTITVDAITIGPRARSRRTGGPFFRSARPPEWHRMDRQPVVAI